MHYTKAINTDIPQEMSLFDWLLNHYIKLSMIGLSNCFTNFYLTNQRIFLTKFSLLCFIKTHIQKKTFCSTISENLMRRFVVLVFDLISFLQCFSYYYLSVKSHVVKYIGIVCVSKVKIQVRSKYWLKSRLGK